MKVCHGFSDHRANIQRHRFGTKLPASCWFFAGALLVLPGSANAAVTITSPSSTSLPIATVGVSYSVPLQASGGVPPYTWGWTPFSFVPPFPGITNSSGSWYLSGTPSSLIPAGTVYPLQIRVTDSAGNYVDGLFSVAVGSSLALNTTTLPGGTVGQSYSASLSASGGTPPYVWTWTGPPGLAWLSIDGRSGAMSGTPTAAGTFSFTVTLVDQLFSRS